MFIMPPKYAQLYDCCILFKIFIIILLKRIPFAAPSLVMTHPLRCTAVHHLSPDNLKPVCHNPASDTQKEREREYLLNKSPIFIYFTLLLFWCFVSCSIAASQKTESRQFGAQRTLIVLWSAPSRRCTRTHTHTHIGELFIYSLLWWEQYFVPSVLCG